MVMGPSRAMEVAVAMAGANCSPASTKPQTRFCAATPLLSCLWDPKKKVGGFSMAFIVYTNSTNPI